MALVKCPDCGKDLSAPAVTCVHCGQPINPAKTSMDPESPAICPLPNDPAPQYKKKAQDSQKQPPRGIVLAVLVILSVCGTGFVIWTTSTFGTGVYSDPVAYISCARNLVAGKGYTYFADHMYVYWPPLFPTLLAALYLVGIDPFVGARFLNAVICGLIVFSSGLLFMKTIRNACLLVFGFLLLVFSSPLLYACSQAGTEPLFIFLSILSVLYLAQFLKNEQWSSLILFSCCAALACLARYIGVTVVLTGCAAILIFMRQCSFFKRLKYAAVSAGTALVPLAAWCIRNYSISKSLTGSKNPGNWAVFSNISVSLQTLAEWFIPDILPPSLMKQTLFMNIVSGLVIALMFFRLKTSNTSRSPAKVLLAAYGFVVVYLLFLCKTLALWFIPHLVPSFLVYVPWHINTALGTTIIGLFFWLKTGNPVRP